MHRCGIDTLHSLLGITGPAAVDYILATYPYTA